MTVETPYARDRVTWLAFGVLAVYAYVLYALGPMLTLLSRDLNLPYAMIGVHSTIFAAGVLVPGLFFSRLVTAFGRRRLLWTAATAVAIGSVMLAAGRGPGLTLPAVAVLGVGGVFLQIMALALLADRHGQRRDRAIVEANAGASAAAVVAPLLVGTLDAVAAGWQFSLALPVAALLVLYLRYGRDTITAVASTNTTPAPAGTRLALPKAFWVLCAVCGLLVGAEFCVVFYGASLLRQDIGVDAGTAAAIMTVFAVGELVGRLVGSRLTSRAGRTQPLLLAALALSAAAFVGVWLSPSLVPAVVTLFVLGLGMANLFPLALSLAVAAAPDRSDDATARTQLVVGVGIMLAPLLLGALADGLGVGPAFGVDLVLLVVAALLLLMRGGRRHSRMAAAEAGERRVVHS
ncbi:MFS transporter [Planosporangium sp. 12N6]|uniref:MFS transporter n=1 Tax=Planosporangium spinosum TaxID=3402278 RepID=UPI003CF1D433